MRARLWIASALCASWAWGCSEATDGRTPAASYEVVQADFMGELVAADTSGWRQEQRSATSEPVARTSGGIDSPLLVGPSVLTLDDGTAITIVPRTPGGTFCPLLDLHRQPNEPPAGLGDGQACLVIGQYEPGTTTAAWFATEVVHRGHAGTYVMTAGFRDGRAVVPAGFGSAVTVPVGRDVTVACGMTFADVLEDADAGYSVTLTADDEVVAIECVARD